MIGILFSSLILMPSDMWAEMQFVLASMVIVFMVGLRDDIDELSPRYKMIGQLIAIAILVTKGGVRLDSFYGLFHQDWQFPTTVSMLLSAFTLLVMINAFNLIDGINGLAGTVGTIISCTFGIWFFMVGEIHLGLLAVATAGSLLGFLRYNMDPAKTFMGDSGSLVVGLMLGVLAIKFIDVAGAGEIMAKYKFSNPVPVCLAILVIPLFDTIRVFSTRIFRGISPFKPDRRHIHHLLVDSGFKHLESTTILGITNLLIISLAFFMDPILDGYMLIALVLGIALLLTFVLHRNVRLIRANREKRVLVEHKA